MESLFNIMYFLVANDPEFPLGPIRDQFLGLNSATSAVFTNTVLLSLLVAIAISAIYYFLLNRMFSLNKIGVWLLVMVLVGGIAFAISYSQVGNNIYMLPDPIGAAGWKFIGMSTFYGMLYFYLFSLLFKRWSRFAKYTPH